ncbi:MAG TPA: amidohydrolase, partial [Candidatus Aphodousia gallistercoris]|nr:amidohydrolase [Candidatus Aphodousia gallistercoris]
MSELDVVKVWEDLHQTPELGFQEVKTSAYIAQKLREMGYEVTEGVGKTGVVAYLRSGNPGPCVMLRADMDALPFVIDGEHKAIHACGHDSHCAMLLAAASRLVDKIKKGTLKLLFQPGEETLKGALSVIEDGVLDDVDMAFGLHIRPVQDAADGQMVAAVCHTASGFFRIDVEGLSSHASR